MTDTMDLQDAWQMAFQGINAISTAASDLESSSNMQQLCNGFTEYLKSLVASLLINNVHTVEVVSTSVPLPPKEENDSHSTQRTYTSILNNLRSLVSSTLHALIEERESKRVGLGQAQQLSRAIDAMRHDVTLCDVFSQRVKELQAQLCLFEEEGDTVVAATVERRGRSRSRLMSIGRRTSSREDEDAAMLEAEKRHAEEKKRLEREVKMTQAKSVLEVQRLVVAMKEKSDALKADNMKLVSDKTALLADKALLLDRVQFLEVQLQSTLVAMRMNASAAAKPGSASSASRGAGVSTLSGISSGGANHNNSSMDKIFVGGVEIEPEVVAWMRDMYISLQNESSLSARVGKGLLDEQQRSPTPPQGSSSTPNSSTTPGQHRRQAPQPPKLYGEVVGKTVPFGDYVKSKKPPIVVSQPNSARKKKENVEPASPVVRDMTPTAPDPDENVVE